jgi:hypothetical protein
MDNGLIELCMDGEILAIISGLMVGCGRTGILTNPGPWNIGKADW